MLVELARKNGGWVNFMVHAHLTRGDIIGQWTPPSAEGEPSVGRDATASVDSEVEPTIDDVSTATTWLPQPVPLPGINAVAPTQQPSIDSAQAFEPIDEGLAVLGQAADTEGNTGLPGIQPLPSPSPTPSAEIIPAHAGLPNTPLPDPGLQAAGFPTDPIDDAEAMASEADEIALQRSYAVAAQIINFNNDESAVFAPVNFLNLMMADLIGDVTSTLGIDDNAVPDPQSPGYPETVDQDGPPIPDTPSGTEDPTDVAIPLPPVDPMDGADLGDNVTERPQITATANDLGVEPQQLPQPDRGEPNAYERCKKPANWNTWIVDLLERKEELVPVGEVHSSTDTNVEFTYGREAESTLGVGIKYSNKNWTVSGGVEIHNTGGAESGPHVWNGTFARQIDGGFDYFKERMTWCPYGYQGRAEDPQPFIDHRIRATIWTGTIDQDTSDLSQWDQRDDWDKAVEEGRTMYSLQGRAFKRTKGKAYKYKAEVVAFGVSLSAQSGYSESVTIKWKFGTSRDYYHLFGNNDRPTVSQIVYAYY